MSPIFDDTANSNGRLVYTGKKDDGPSTLNIHTKDCLTGTHECRAFLPNQQRGMVICRDRNHSRPHNIQLEHGRFKDVELFTEICTNQRIPDQQEQVFEDWVLAVLSTLKRDHEDLWVPYIT